MGMHPSKEYDKILDRLSKHQTDKVRYLIPRRIGRPPEFTKTRVNKDLDRLKELATTRLLKTRPFKKFSSQRGIVKKRWQVTPGKGWGWERKQESFVAWFEKTIPYRYCVYMFMNGSKSLYVGRTTKGSARPGSHFRLIWCGKATRVNIYATKKQTELPRLECLAIHRFNPTRNKIKAQKKKWNTHCPICKAHKVIETEVRRIYPICRLRK